MTISKLSAGIILVTAYGIMIKLGLVLFTSYGMGFLT